MARGRNIGLGGMIQQTIEFWDEFLKGRVGGRQVSRHLHRFGIAMFLVLRGFVQNRGPTRAAALSYVTLLALVPLLAVMLSVSKNFLKETSADVVPRVLDKAVSMVAPQLEHVPLAEDEYGPPAPSQAAESAEATAQVVAQIQTFIDGIDAGKLGTIGTFLLVIVALRLMNTIENTFNDIWGVQEGRSIWKKIVYYWSTITLGPLLLVLAVYLTGKLEYMRQYSEVLLGIAWVKRIVLNLAPYVLLWLAFTAMYALMPNTHVRPKAAFIGGVVGGTLWQLNSTLSTLYISRVVTYSKIYGGLGALPVLLLGLYFSWLIILFGAQVSFAAQNIHAYLQQRASERVDQAGRERVACRMMFVACEHFLNGKPAPSIENIAERLQLPTQLLNQVLHRLREGGLLAEVADGEGGVAPGRDPGSVRVSDVLATMRRGTDADDVLSSDHAAAATDAVLADLDALIETASANETFTHLVGEKQSA